jgi:AbiU2
VSSNTRTVARVSVTRDEIPMLVPPYIDQHAPAHIKVTVQVMLRITKEVRTILGQFYLYLALTRNRPLSKMVVKSSAAEGARIVIGSLMRTLVVSVAGLFDDDPQTSNLPKLIRAGLTREAVAFFSAFHGHYDVPVSGESARQKLIKYQRAMSRSPLRPAIDRIKRVRRTIVAHFDAAPEGVPQDRRALVRDYDHIIAAAAVITGEANKWMIGRTVDAGELRKILRADAGGFCDVLMRGAEAVSPPALSSVSSEARTSSHKD